MSLHKIENPVGPVRAELDLKTVHGLVWFLKPCSWVLDMKIKHLELFLS